MADKTKIAAFETSPQSDLAAEHAMISKFVAQAEKTCGRYCLDVSLKEVPLGVEMLAAKPAMGRKLVRAAVEQAAHWDTLREKLIEGVLDGHERAKAEMGEQGQAIARKRVASVAIVKTLLRRKLPLERDDLLEMARWCMIADSFHSHTYPLGLIVRAVELYADANPLDEELIVALRSLSKRLGARYEPDLKRVAAAIDRVIFVNDSDHAELEKVEAPIERRAAPGPAEVGSPSVLTELKSSLQIPTIADPIEATVIGGDQFPLRSDSPLADQHELLSLVLEEVVASNNTFAPQVDKLPHGSQLSDAPDDIAASLFLAAAERKTHSLQTLESDNDDPDMWDWRIAATSTIRLVRDRGIPWRREEAFDAFLFLATSDLPGPGDPLLAELVDAAERFAREEPLSEGERYVLALLRESLVSKTTLGIATDEEKRMTKMIGDRGAFCLSPGEYWSDLVNEDYATWEDEERANWNAFFRQMLLATSSRPSPKWLKKTSETLEPIGEAKLVERLQRWLPEVSRGKSVHRRGWERGGNTGIGVMIEDNATILRGLLWVIPTLKRREDLLRLITTVTLSAYKKVPGVGARAVKVGNAAVYALSELGTTDAVGQLAILKVRVKFGTAQKEIEKAFTKTAEALGMPRNEIEEMGVPSYGLTEVGRLTETLGDYTAAIEVTGSNAALVFDDAKGKRLKSVPAKVRTEHADELKDLKQSLKDINALLPAQRDRIDSMFLGQRSWPIAAWRERYLDHPLIGTIARRLIWCVDGEPVIFVDGIATAVNGSPVEHGGTAEITLWHPVGRPVEEIIAWRERLETLELTQPFKQAHREVYLLTAAEENTRTYSNRFAAHVLRQHQFNALCGARGWKNQLRLMVDQSFSPPTKYLPQWNLRAEFWIEGIGDDYDVDTTESGTFLYLATDQVRFYRLDAAENWAYFGGGGYTTNADGPGAEGINEPLPLAEIPPLVFSEVMRDVDLFVGVASVGNDPNWQDGGPDGRYRDYWNSYSFGELSENATTRKAVLERLVPRLKIADRCSFVDRFLVVRGDVRTYKIHLGSGNILMEPNDEYLCIVPDSRASKAGDDMFLPFEGDRTLSIVLSKALLLANDTKIKDPTILSQINR